MLISLRQNESTNTSSRGASTLAAILHVEPSRRDDINVRIRDYLTGGKEDGAFPGSKAKVIEGLKYFHVFKPISNCRNE